MASAHYSHAGEPPLGHSAQLPADSNNSCGQMAREEWKSDSEPSMRWLQEHQVQLYQKEASRPVSAWLAALHCTVLVQWYHQANPSCCACMGARITCRAVVALMLAGPTTMRARLFMRVVSSNMAFICACLSTWLNSCSHISAGVKTPQ